MPNTQIREPHHPSDGNHLDVHSIFLTIQGEGPLAGVPAVFIRLAGCNLQCLGCDTEYTDATLRQRMDLDAILSRVQSLHVTNAPHLRLIVITGGEPFRQNIAGLCRRLIAQGYSPQIETNGTLPPSTDFPHGDCVVVCSPKAGKVHPDLLPFITAWKYVVEAGYVSPVDGLPTTILGGATISPARPPQECDALVFVTPLDKHNVEENKANVAAALDSCIKFNYVFGFQIHKQVNLP